MAGLVITLRPVCRSGTHAGYYLHAGWEKTLEEHNDMAAIDRLVERFAVPLQGALVNTEEVEIEFKEMISYATQYIALAVLDYKSVTIGGGSSMLMS